MNHKCHNIYSPRLSWIKIKQCQILTNIVSQFCWKCKIVENFCSDYRGRTVFRQSSSLQTSPPICNDIEERVIGYKISYNCLRYWLRQAGEVAAVKFTRVFSFTVQPLAQVVFALTFPRWWLVDRLERPGGQSPGSDLHWLSVSAVLQVS